MLSGSHVQTPFPQSSIQLLSPTSSLPTAPSVHLSCSSPFSLSFFSQLPPFLTLALTLKSTKFLSSAKHWPRLWYPPFTQTFADQSIPLFQTKMMSSLGRATVQSVNMIFYITLCYTYNIFWALTVCQTLIMFNFYPLA